MSCSRCVYFPPSKSFVVFKMLQIHIEEGSMTCPNCKHVYPISNGIPNMVRLEHLTGCCCQHWVLAVGRTQNRLKLAFHKNELVHQVQVKARILFIAGRGVAIISHQNQCVIVQEIQYETTPTHLDNHANDICRTIVCSQLIIDLVLQATALHGDTSPHFF